MNHQAYLPHAESPFVWGMGIIFLGFDPGGVFGVSVLRLPAHGPATAVVGSVRSVDDAVDWAVRQCRDETPRAAGIDTLLCWSTERCGWRPMDVMLRNAFPDVQASVLSSNSAFGAMAVQGMAIALRLKERWPDVLLNETHPKVLYHAMTSKNYTRDDIPTMTAWLQQQFRPRVECVIRDEHQWDALISAWATWQGFSGKWIADLVVDVGGTRLLFPVGQVSYYWPKVIQA